jgi:pimeloyl-ACP methyl ester carboxylesterase
LWRPTDHARTTRPGIYLLEAVDERKTPVLFVHGINDSPASFAYLIDRLDRSRFQPWVYSYPSGARLDTVTDHLDRTMQEMRKRYRFPPVALVAHSMGGLIARGFILRQGDSASSVPVALFVSISTPWEGHEAARLGAKLLPSPVAVWRDIAPGSGYLHNLFKTDLPSRTPHYLLFTYSGGRNSVATGDRTVTLASQLALQAQRDATRVFGFNDTHKRILRNEGVSSLLNDLLSETFDTPTGGAQYATR